MVQIKTNGKYIVDISYQEEKKDGWIEIESMPEPENKEGYYSTPYYINGKVVYEYDKIPKQQMDIMRDMAYKGNIVKKIREKYSMDDEIAILRQRDSKPKEFEEYNRYVESIKKELKPHE